MITSERAETFFERTKRRASESRKKDEIVILGIESSCDETAASIVVNGRKVESSVISTQIDIHKRFGGVVPEIASRNHTMQLCSVVTRALEDAGRTLADVDAIAVTKGAGLVGALLAGISFAKGLAFANGIPLVGVNHIRGHIAANYIEDASLEPPFLCLLASGGHTAILRVDDYAKHTLIGTTVDDAAGEAFDKVARVLGLEYPGGPKVSALAKEGRNSIVLPAMFKGEKHYHLSYSGLKTAVVNLVHTATQRGEEVNKADLCCSFEHAALDPLVERAFRAAREFGMKTICLAGGVAANDYLRTRVLELANKKGMRCVIPEKRNCTDNAAMIAAEGYLQFMNDNLSDLDLNAEPSLRPDFVQE